MTTDSLFRLEQMLRYYEDTGFEHASVERLCRTSERYREHYSDTRFSRPWHFMIHSLRGLLLGAVGGTSQQTHPAYEVLMTKTFVQMLYRWCQGSRRIYRLAPDLQLLIGATAVDRVRITDINFPFETFAIAFERPLVDADGTEFDFLMVDRERSTEGPKVQKLVFQLFSRKLLTYRPLSGVERQKIKKLLDRPREHDKAARELRMVRNRLNAFTAEKMHGYGTWKHGETPESEHTLHNATIVDLANFAADSKINRSSEAMSQAIRIGLGLCLYLGMCSSDKRTDEMVTRVPLPAALRGPRMVTDGAEVCLVQSMHVLTPEERKAFGTVSSGRSDVSPHFRSGYWCRPPGKGNDPLAGKTVWHRPTIVCRDKLPDDALPLGAQSRVK